MEKFKLFMEELKKKLKTNLELAKEEWKDFVEVMKFANREAKKEWDELVEEAKEKNENEVEWEQEEGLEQQKVSFDGEPIELAEQEDLEK